MLSLVQILRHQVYLSLRPLVSCLVLFQLVSRSSELLLFIVQIVGSLRHLLEQLDLMVFFNPI